MIGIFPLSDACVGQQLLAAPAKKPPPNRVLKALKDQRLAPEAR